MCWRKYFDTKIQGTTICFTWLNWGSFHFVATAVFEEISTKRKTCLHTSHIFFKPFFADKSLQNRGSEGFHFLQRKWLGKALKIINKSYQKLPFGSGDDPDKLFFFFTKH